MLSTRIFATVLIISSITLFIIGQAIVTEFNYEPLGPRPFPLATLFLIACCSILLFFFAEKTHVQWCPFKVNLRLAYFALCICFYASVFELLGFMIATALFVFFVSLAFKAKPIFAGLFGIFIGLLFYYLFDTLMQITLPLGLIFE